MSTTETISKSNLDDEVLIGLIKNGEQNLFSLIMKRHNQRMYRTAISFGISDFDSDDIIQQAYINAFEKIEQFRGQAKFSTWLTRIMINECLMYKRKQKSENQKFVYNNENVTNLISDHQTPEIDYLNDEMKNLLEEAIKRLPEKYRTIYVMREIENIPVTECSAILDISGANVKVRLLRAKGLLKEELLKSFDKNEVLSFGNRRCDNIVKNVMTYLKLQHD